MSEKIHLIRVPQYRRQQVAGDAVYQHEGKPRVLCANGCASTMQGSPTTRRRAARYPLSNSVSSLF